MKRIHRGKLKCGTDYHRARWVGGSQKPEMTESCCFDARQQPSTPLERYCDQMAVTRTTADFGPRRRAPRPLSYGATVTDSQHLLGYFCDYCQPPSTSQFHGCMNLPH
jgi:hypothetical protein